MALGEAHAEAEGSWGQINRSGEGTLPVARSGPSHRHSIFNKEPKVGRAANAAAVEALTHAYSLSSVSSNPRILMTPIETSFAFISSLDDI